MPEREPKGWRNLKAGVFFLATTAVLFAALFVVGTNSRLFERKYELKCFLPNAQQLGKGSMVALAGLEVGKIDDIRFARREDGNNIELVLQLPLKRQHQITTSSVATIRTVGVLGDRFIDITMGQPGEKPIPRGGEIKIMAPTDWPATFQKAAGALDDFLKIVNKTSEAVEKLDRGEGTLAMLLNDPNTAQNLRDAVTNLAQISRGLQEGKGSLGRLMKDDSMARQLEVAISRFDSLSTMATSGDGLLPRLLSDHEMAAGMGRVVAGADTLMSQLRGEGTAAHLIQRDELYHQMLSTMEEVHALVQKIQEHPERYLSISLF
ncbi:MAG TPA: MlaD family protein [Candidatus Krumholzibacteria bacterium]|nr:MlaD family protein [Candidatus Krumholzibacteria bacterium]